MNMRALGAAAVVVVAGVAGCGSGGVRPASAAASTQASSSAAPTPSGAATPSAELLKSALLTPQDLGSGFAPTSTAPGVGGSTGTGCPPLDAFTGPASGNASQQEADFSSSDGLAYLSEILAGGAPADVSTAYSQVSAALRACSSWTLNSGGTRLTLSLTPIRFGGSNSTAVRLDGRLSGTEVNGYMAFEDLGTVLLGYVYFQVGSGDSQLAHYEFTQAETKAEHVLGVLPI